jgi:hypothetical protein
MNARSFCEAALSVKPRVRRVVCRFARLRSEVPLSLLFALSDDDAVAVGALGDPIGRVAPN